MLVIWLFVIQLYVLANIYTLCVSIDAENITKI